MERNIFFLITIMILHIFVNFFSLIKDGDNTFVGGSVLGSHMREIEELKLRISTLMDVQKENEEKIAKSKKEIAGLQEKCSNLH